jgi:hypothetical protein
VQLKVPLVEECDSATAIRDSREIMTTGNGRFGLEWWGVPRQGRPLPYQYVVERHHSIRFMAQNCVLGDEIFQTQGGGGWRTRLIRGGTTYDAALTKVWSTILAMPWGCTHTGTVTSYLLWTALKIADKYHEGRFPAPTRRATQPTYMTMRDLLIMPASRGSTTRRRLPVRAAVNAFDMIAAVATGPRE